ncbi:uncharacterized protein LOC105215380 [Zeugodacus cucurbitae]|uniref:uncharacterized protein LOC105215380 n=1 Tax=Zeugodacus cucurbitae TaxID=28588 RepID=UPI000596A1F7|nr:uncharacterized protein LOC105215380 [Zeugodacus cucurbitae]
MEYFKLVLVLLALCACASAFTRLPRSNDENDDDVTEPLGIASVKSRAIAMDRGLCRELSRYHPHYPRCQEYCKKLNHWMGMCRRESCHCYS